MLASVSYATQQVQDSIIYKGESYNLEPFIFEQYFAKHPKYAPEESINSSLWRGYTASFTITNDLLVLRDINTRTKGDENKSLKSDIFPNQEIPVMDWFTGILILGRGKEVPRSAFNGFRISFESYILLEVDKGRINREKRLTEKQVKPFIDKQWATYKKTDEYRNLLNRMKAGGYGDPEGDIQSYIILRDRIPKFYEE